MKTAKLQQNLAAAKLKLGRALTAFKAKHQKAATAKIHAREQKQKFRLARRAAKQAGREAVQAQANFEELAQIVARLEKKLAKKQGKKSAPSAKASPRTGHAATKMLTRPKRLP